MNNKKILIITPRFHTNMYYFVKALENKGYCVKILSVYEGISEYKKSVDVEIIGFSKWFNYLNYILSGFKKIDKLTLFVFRFGFPNIKKIKKVLFSFKPDKVIIKDFKNVIFHSVLSFSNKYSFKVFVMIQTEVNKIKGSRLLFKIYHKYIEKKGVVNYISPLKQTINSFNSCGLYNVYYQPFIYEINDFEKIFFKDGFINILCIGKFVRRKNQLFLLKVLNKLKKFNWKLSLVGEKVDDKYLEEIKDFVKVNNLILRVNFYFNLKYNKMSEVYKNHDVFVLPSYGEPAAYSIVEAMAHKLPVICSKYNGTRCYIEENRNGFVFDGTENDLKNKLLILLTEKNNIVNFSKLSYQLYLKNHNKLFFDLF
jgi:glycosyltransferase involved in cell wall biosynthesis